MKSLKYQQGDVLLYAISEIPEGKQVKKSARGYVLAEGEATGHAHVIDEDIQLVEVNGTLYMKCENDTTIVHEEHGDIKIDKGSYEIGIVQEYDHFAEEARNVVD